MSEERRSYDVNKPMSASRLIEMAVAVVITSVVSAGLASLITVKVLEESVDNLKASQDEIKGQLRELRRDFYRPAWPEREQGMELDWQDFREDLKNSLHTAGRRFEGTDTDPDDDWRRFTLAASAALAERRGRTLVGEISLVADQAEYSAPADLIYLKAPIWARSISSSPGTNAIPAGCRAPE